MMKSMTGFGRGEASFSGGKMIVELSSVNRKQFELRTNLPRELIACENFLRKEINAKITRGSVALRVVRSAAESTAAAASRIDHALLDALIDECRRHDPNADVPLAALLAVPGVVLPASNDADAEISGAEEAALDAALRGALENFEAMRCAEGENLLRDTAMRLARLEALVETIRPAAASIKAALRTKLMESMKAEFGGMVDCADERLLKEILFYTDKADVTEELTRLGSHFAQFHAFLKAEAVQPGRSLDFLIQEMFREITTLGNKAGSVAISPRVVEFKAELEKLREQIQNVE
ncbi:MAG: YicC family protein [Victivallaceae bacterium]|nr:YicC family protein [Victivallaceae bacterium]